MARRRSARLASSAKAEPTAAPPKNLESVTEREESPVNESTRNLDAIMASPSIYPRTPSAKSLMKPPMSEMHPSKVHPTTAAPSSALRLGFTDIKTANSKTPGANALQSTPSKVNTSSSPFTFQCANPSATDSKLGPEAQRIMNELRGEAAIIRAELAAKRDQERLEEDQVNARKIAQPKGKAGRYSAVHMADFKKMDSIENHPSAFRASKSTPVAASSKGVKRSQSKANLNDSETAGIKTPAKIPSSKSSRKVNASASDPESPAKRAKQGLNEDASTNRPVSRDTSNIPRPKTIGKGPCGTLVSKSVTNMESPTQASLSRAASTNTPTATRSLLKSPSKMGLTGLKKSATVGDLALISDEKEEGPAQLRSPNRFGRIKSLFAKHKGTVSAPKPGIPRPIVGVSKTPAPLRVQRELPPAPQTTPGKKNSVTSGHVTPAPKHAALAQNSPSPVKSCIPRSKTTNSLANYPSLDSVMTNATADQVSYPDLSGYRPLPEPPKVVKSISLDDDVSEDSEQASASVPGTFTFRSDHTIEFGASSPKGFGASAGKSSVRQVRPSLLPTIPGAFPSTDMLAMAAPKGKENMPPYLQQAPFDVKAFPHGVSNRKRLRVEDDEEEADREAAERAAKKKKAAKVPEGEALVAPRLASAQKPRVRSPSKSLMKTPARSPVKSRAPATTPGGRKIAGISMSRLSYLATPKQRK